MPDLTLTTPLDGLLATTTVAGALTYLGETKSANLVWCGPVSGSAAAPTFRALVAADIPSLNYSTFSGAYADLTGKPALGTMAGQDSDGVDISNGSAVLSNLTTGNATITGGTMDGVTITNSPISGSTGAFTTLRAPGIANGVGGNIDDDFIVSYSAGQNRKVLFRDITGTNTDVRLSYFGWDFGSAPVLFNGGNAILTGPVPNTLALSNPPNDQTFRVGSPSGTGGGVLVLHQSAAAPTPTSEDVQISFDGTNCIVDKPLSGVGSGLTGVPGTLTIDSGWTANGDDGDKAAVIGSEGNIISALADEGGSSGALEFGVAYPAVASLLHAALKQLKALRADVRDHKSPDN